MKRPIYLTGLMGAGKSAVGLRVAERLGVGFIDLDTLIERRAGRRVAELFAEQGEQGFRSLERAALDEALACATSRVVALGGGALLDRELRVRLLGSVCLISLRAEAAILAGRVGSGQGRPLLSGADPEAVLRRLLADRADGYAECHAMIDTGPLTIEEAAEQVIEAASRDDLAVAAGARSYRVRISDAAADEGVLKGLLGPLGATSLVAISDTNVAPLVRDEILRAAGGLRLGLHVLEAGERAKGLEGLAGCWQAMQREGLDRRGVVVGVGGGVVTDIAGLAAGTWLRGVRWVAAPTTLLGMVDAAIGGKTAIDFGPAKNVVGVFHQPQAVCIEVRRVLTEPRRSFVSGLAEVVKSALVGDAALFDRLERGAEALLGRELESLAPVVRAAAAVKVNLVSRDERDSGERLLLNLGHTFGHALEAAGGFERWMHGEAVSLGMIAALEVGVRLGVTPVDVLSRTRSVLARFGLPTALSRADVDEALPLLGHDKKREDGEIRFVLVDAIGRAHTRRISLEQLTKHLAAAASGPSGSL
jgi:shikimate kinase / 3-dehydroquinate synthase